MKNRHFFSMLAFLFTISILFSTSCKEDDDDDNPPDNGDTPESYTDSRDGQSYKTVKIGNQTWFAENLNYETQDSWCYENDPANCNSYGRLYEWSAAKEACPPGWHLPSDDEWCAMLSHADASVSCDETGWIGTDVGMKIRSSGGWGNYNGSDAVGFNALPCGYCNHEGNFNNMGMGSFFWSSTESSEYNAIGYYLLHAKPEVNRNMNFKGQRWSVRCVKN